MGKQLAQVRHFWEADRGKDVHKERGRSSVKNTSTMEPGGRVCWTAWCYEMRLGHRFGEDPLGQQTGSSVSGEEGVKFKLPYLEPSLERSWRVLCVSISKRKRRERSVSGRRCGSQQSYSVFKIGNTWDFNSLCLFLVFGNSSPCLLSLKSMCWNFRGKKKQKKPLSIIQSLEKLK